MAPRLFRAWIDETGDRGSGAKSSPFFGFCAVVIPADLMVQVNAAKAALNVRLGRLPTHELHWSQTLRNHDARAEAVDAISTLPIRIIYVVIEKASMPPGSFMAASKDGMYNYPLRLLLERISWLARDQNAVAAVTLASVAGLPSRIPIAYVERLQASGSGPNGTNIAWSALRPKIEVHQAHARDGLQVADIAAGALDRAIRPTIQPPHRMEPAYLAKLAPLVYCRGKGKIGTYGMKALPTDLWSRFDWWPSMLDLTKNA